MLARPERAPLSKSYTPYVVEGGRPITQSKNFIWKTIVKKKEAVIKAEWKMSIQPFLFIQFSYLISDGGIAVADTENTGETDVEPRTVSHFSPGIVLGNNNVVVKNVHGLSFRIIFEVDPDDLASL